jgi:hypothetical protein
LYWRKLVFVPWKYMRETKHIITVVNIVAVVMRIWMTKAQIG